MAVAKDGSKQMMSFAIDKDVKVQAEEIAKGMGLNLSAYIRMAIIERIKKDKEG